MTESRTALSDPSEPKRTALCDSHIAAGGKMVDFAGWYMPVNYGSQIQEHEAVRSDAGMFDVSHMTIIDVAGKVQKSFYKSWWPTTSIGWMFGGRCMAPCLIPQAASLMI